MLCEILKEKVNKYKIKIFATDIDDESLKIARTGIYAETSLVNMKKEYIQRYFTILKNQFEVKKSIRELVIFSQTIPSTLLSLQRVLTQLHASKDILDAKILIGGQAFNDDMPAITSLCHLLISNLYELESYLKGANK